MRRRIFLGCGGFLALLTLLAGGTAYWYYHRQQPSPEERPLFQGVRYRREARQTPRPLVVHILTVDLDAPGVSVWGTPGDAGQDKPFTARTTSQFLREFHLQAAINADFFFPWWSNAPWSYYPHVGDRVRTEGDAVAQGTLLCRRPRDVPEIANAETRLTTLYISREGRAVIDSKRKPEGAYIALGGHELFSRPDAPALPSWTKTIHPRTAVGVSRSGKRLLLVVVDGRQPNYSEGMTSPEMDALMRDLGAEQAMLLDGGGSTTMAVADVDGRPRVMNSPIDNRIPGRERPVANHLGIYARPL